MRRVKNGEEEKSLVVVNDTYSSSKAISISPTAKLMSAAASVSPQELRRVQKPGFKRDRSACKVALADY
ncbi:MAG: hypothetical protein KME30_09545 [Iphinoe sp. HA4291-MV1]|nr:hypothetical protein [Iphinoe sp. HA4291-MV1]